MKPMPSSSTGETRFWRPVGLGGAELVFASYGRYAFPRHFHEEYLIANMVRGVERLRHARGSDLAPAGSLILLNPGQVHENGAVDEAGFAYRTLYVPLQLMERASSISAFRRRRCPCSLTRSHFIARRLP